MSSDSDSDSLFRKFKSSNGCENFILSDEDVVETNIVLKKPKRCYTPLSDDVPSDLLDVSSYGRDEYAPTFYPVHRSSDFQGVSEVHAHTALYYRDNRRIDNDNKSFSIDYTTVKNIAEYTPCFAHLLSTEGAHVIMRRILGNERRCEKSNSFLDTITPKALMFWEGKSKPSPPTRLLDRKGYFDLLSYDGSIFLINVITHFRRQGIRDPRLPDVEELVRAYRMYRTTMRSKGKKQELESVYGTKRCRENAFQKQQQSRCRFADSDDEPIGKRTIQCGKFVSSDDEPIGKRTIVKYFM